MHRDWFARLRDHNAQTNLVESVFAPYDYLSESKDVTSIFQVFRQNFAGKLQSVFKVAAVADPGDLSRIGHADDQNAPTSICKTGYVLRKGNLRAFPVRIRIGVPDCQRFLKVPQQRLRSRRLSGFFNERFPEAILIYQIALLDEFLNVKK